MGRIMCPDEMTSNKMSAVFEATGRNGGYIVKNKKLDSPLDDPAGKVMEILSEHCCEGWLEGYLLTGRHGLFPCYEAFTSVIDSMINQHCKWLKATSELEWRKDLASLNFLLTSHTWRQDHNGYSHQVTGFIDNAVHKPGTVVNIYLPPDANCLLHVGRASLASKHRVNVIIAGKHPMPQWLTLAEAEAHVAVGRHGDARRRMRCRARLRGRCADDGDTRGCDDHPRAVPEAQDPRRERCRPHDALGARPRRVSPRPRHARGPLRGDLRHRHPRDYVLPWLSVYSA